MSFSDLVSSGTITLSDSFAPALAGTDWNGEKFMGGMAGAADTYVDYESLRKHSHHLFTTSLYAKGLINRLITNEIHSGLELEASPTESLSGMSEEDLNLWDEDVEDRFFLWCCNSGVADSLGEESFFSLQKTVRMESLLDGDILVVVNIDPTTQLPKVRLVPARNVIGGPIGDYKLSKGNRVEEGVEVDRNGKQVAYWVSEDGSMETTRVPAYAKDGRRMAWLVYGSMRRLGNVRGEPLLSTVLQSIRELDKYRGSVQRRAVVQSMFAVFLKKTENVQGTFNPNSAAVRRTVQNNGTANDPDRKFKTADLIPGIVIEELSQGEEPVAFGNNTADLHFQEFEEAITCAIAWSNGVPPEILKLSFNSNYSASQAANNEFRSYLDYVRDYIGSTFCQPIYQEWLIGEVLQKRIKCAQLIDAIVSKDFAKTEAWYQATWSAAVKPATDLKKLVSGYIEQINNGLITRERAMKELGTGSFRREARKMLREAITMQAIMKESPWVMPPVVVQAPVDDSSDTNHDDNEDDAQNQVEKKGK